MRQADVESRKHNSHCNKVCLIPANSEPPCGEVRLPQNTSEHGMYLKSRREFLPCVQNPEACLYLDPCQVFHRSRCMKRIHILLIEDNRLLREGLAAMLKEQPDLKVVASAGNSDATTQARKLKPTVILLDLGLSGQNSLRLLGILKKNSPDARVIGMDLVPVQEELVQYVEEGVCGFVLKDATFDDLLRTIRSVARGVNVLPPPLAGSLFSQIAEHATVRSKGNPFTSVRMTNREREVITLIAEGLSNKEIANRLHLATDTVKSHVHNILDKLALHTRLEVARYAHSADSYEQQPSPRKIR
jgi:DNA-binding NarL/FixJ family response regulator